VAAIKDGKFVPSDAEPTVLFDKDFDGLDSAAKTIQSVGHRCTETGFKPITMMEMIEFEGKLLGLQKSH